MSEREKISENSQRIAKNTLFLYFRMLLILFVGLFTSRVVLQTLGKADFGTYNVVAGVVTMFTAFTNSIAAAITRFITSELGKGDKEKLSRVFATSIIIQIIFCVVLFILTETVGVWYLKNRMVIPEGRLDAAGWVLQCAMVQLMVVLLSVPFNATIMAHEHMKAFALISILEAFLKLALTLILYISGFDKLKTYAVLMVSVSLIVRFTYGAYCNRHFEESRAKLKFDRDLIKEMLGFAGWNALSSSVFLFNTQGLNILTNLFFGVLMNAARGVAMQVENTIKPFVFNVINAINPQITKSYVTDNKEYSFNLVSKGAKYAYLIVLFFLVPTIFEGDTILQMWLKNVPEYAALFTKLTLVCVMLDVTFTAGSTLILADGHIKWFYIIISSISVLIFPLTLIAFRLGAPAQMAYLIFIAVYVLLDIAKLILLHRITGYSYNSFFGEVIAKVIGPTIVTFLCGWAVTRLIPDPTWWRAIISVGICTIGLVISVYFLGLSKGEKDMINSKIFKR